MVPLLLDEGVPPGIARAFCELALDAYAVGDGDAPPRGGSDEANARWCAARGAILVTNDRGKKDKAIFDALAQHHVHALFITKELLAVPPHFLARALLNAEAKIDLEVAKQRGLLRARLRPNGGLDHR